MIPRVPDQSGVMNILESSDLKDSFKELNDDSIDNEGFTAIDMRTKLTASQVPALVGLDILAISGVYPREFSRIGRAIKRLSISIGGGGRKDMVNIAKGNQARAENMGKSIIERAGTE